MEAVCNCLKTLDQHVHQRGFGYKTKNQNQNKSEEQGRSYCCGEKPHDEEQEKEKTMVCLEWRDELQPPTSNLQPPTQWLKKEKESVWRGNKWELGI